MSMQKGCYIPVICNDCDSAPSIGENGNWYIGDTDTGVKAQGKDGEPGVQGPLGLQGPAGPQGIQGETGAKGEDVDVSRIEVLEAQVSKMFSDFSAYNSGYISDYNIYAGTIPSVYTATEKCLITVYAYMTRDAYIYVSINGIRVITMQSDNDMRYIILNKNDEINISTGGTINILEVKKYTAK